MDASHETHDSGSFWSYANLIFAVGFGGFALISSASLIFQAFRPQPAPVTGNQATAAVAAPAASTSAGGVTEILLKPGSPNPMSYDKTAFTVKAGQKVKVTFANTGSLAPLQHNFVLCQPGSKERVIALANAMMTDMAKSMASGFIPTSPDVIAHIKLLNPGETGSVEFTVPKPGEYPYMCTFPGHSMIMNGTMKAE